MPNTAAHVRAQSARYGRPGRSAAGARLRAMRGDALTPLAARLRGRTLGECLAAGRDNFLALRFAAALMVVLGHSFVLCGPALVDADPAQRLFGNTYTHFLGVMTFFVISGFLITLSWQRRPDLARYLTSRALRILPALIVCVGLTAFLLGPVLTTWPLAGYLHSAATWHYLIGNASLVDLRWRLPGVFADNPVSGFVNGSLWTLPVETGLYLAVAATGVCGVLRRRWLANAVILALALLLVGWPLARGETLGLGTIMAAFFGIGALAAINREQVPMSTALLVIVVVVCWASRDTAMYRYLLAFTIAYACLWIAYVPRLPAPPGGADWSYGTYLWGFPVQQTLIAEFGIRSPWLLFGASLAPVLLLAGLSWYVVERPMLQFKRTRIRSAGPTGTAW
ncbi:MAG TPA: acyltransferase [Rhodanobacteraceae bacterium]|nr:acyltransferase [Rhodanobacteraceae bacterium]